MTQFMCHLNLPFYAASSVYPIFYFGGAIIIIYFKQTNKQTCPHQLTLKLE